MLQFNALSRKIKIVLFFMGVTSVSGQDSLNKADSVSNIIMVDSSENSAVSEKIPLPTETQPVHQLKTLAKIQRKNTIVGAS
ncbi:MAG: hypothetical protein ACM31E_03675, partial [Fibrobacterota bacterium]